MSQRWGWTAWQQDTGVLLSTLHISCQCCRLMISVSSIPQGIPVDMPYDKTVEVRDRYHRAPAACEPSSRPQHHAIHCPSSLHAPWAIHDLINRSPSTFRKPRGICHPHRIRIERPLGPLSPQGKDGRASRSVSLRMSQRVGTPHCDQFIRQVVARR